MGGSQRERQRLQSCMQSRSFPPLRPILLLVQALLLVVSVDVAENPTKVERSLTDGEMFFSRPFPSTWTSVAVPSVLCCTRNRIERVHLYDN